MTMAKHFAALLVLGAWFLVTVSACETSKHAEIMSTEDLRAQAPMSSETESDQTGMPLDMASDSQESLEFPQGARSPASDYVPEPPPQPAISPEPEAELEVKSEAEPEMEAEMEPEMESEAISETVSEAISETVSEAISEAESGEESGEEPKAVSEAVSEEVSEEAFEEASDGQFAQLDPSDFAPESEAEDDSARGMSEMEDSGLDDIFFNYDEYKIRADAVAMLENNAQLLKTTYENSSVVIEGHCDERGTADYNLELGKRRAQAVKDYLIDLGIQESRIEIVSYGKERPFCTESEPACWQQNRRGHFVRQQ